MAGDPRRPAILCISHSFTPETTPTAIRAGKLLAHLAGHWEPTVLTASAPQPGPAPTRAEVVGPRGPVRLLSALRRLRLSRLIELAVWPDDAVFWVLPAIRRGRRLIRERSPAAIVVFMMPYSAGLVGVALAAWSGLPLILNLDDSPTCSDMHPHFPTRLHHRLARALEDFYVRRADAIVYVSERNLDLVASRQVPENVEKFHLVRYGADPEDFHPRTPHHGGFEVVYVGAMSGWWSLIENPAERLPARALALVNRLGRHHLVTLDQRTSSPAVVGRAIRGTIATHPSWEGRVGLTLWGNPYPEALVSKALAAAGVEDVVSVNGPVRHAEVAAILAAADLLFLTLPARLDGSPGGRISAKTYEYLATDRPILAAVPKGENWDYLAGRPGVWLVEPDDEAGMQQAISELAEAKFAGAQQAFERDTTDLSYRTRAAEFETAIRDGIERRRRTAG